MKRFFSALWPMLAVVAACWFLLDIVLGNILLTVAFAIAGEQFYFLPWILLVTVFYGAVSLVTHRVIKS